MTSARTASQPLVDWRLGIVLAGYVAAWHLLAPLFFAYLWLRGNREPLYRQFWGERLGLSRAGATRSRPVWVHAASIGELKGAAPVIEALLGHGFCVVVTTWTPAGRQAAQDLFASAREAGCLYVRYVPAEWPWAVSSFIRRWNPVCAMATESEVWPVLLRTIRAQGVPLCKANAQYPRTSYERDLRLGGLRARLYRHYELVMCKSDTHAQRFLEAGCGQVEVVGETRFEQSVSPLQLQQAKKLRQAPGWTGRPVVCIASAVEGEESVFVDLLLELRTRLDHPLFIYVPRSPQGFETIVERLQSSGFRVRRRSVEFCRELAPLQALDWAGVDVLLGDSLGEMFFYLGLADAVVVGGSFVDRGGHNIIEPLLLGKPVWVGPSIWGIEYPAVEALQDGVLQQASNAQELSAQLVTLLSDPAAYAQRVGKAQAFLNRHAGSSTRHMTVFLPWLHNRRPS